MVFPKKREMVFKKKEVFPKTKRGFSKLISTFIKGKKEIFYWKMLQNL
jgi:hypothetical protein